MSGGTLAKKLLVKPGYRGALVNAPAGFAKRLEPLPEGASVAEGAGPGNDLVLAFAKDAAELRRVASSAARLLKPEGLLWICYPKGGRSDLSRDVLWDTLSREGLTGVTLVSIDPTWSAMRFRPAGQTRPTAPRAVDRGGRTARRDPPSAAGGARARPSADASRRARPSPRRTAD